MLYIRDIRLSRKMTMKELGKKVGVTESAIQLYETGKRKPDYEMLLKISEALDCSVLDLIATRLEAYTPEEIDLINCYRKATEKERQSINFILKDYK